MFSFSYSWMNMTSNLWILKTFRKCSYRLSISLQNEFKRPQTFKISSHYKERGENTGFAFFPISRWTQHEGNLTQIRLVWFLEPWSYYHDLQTFYRFNESMANGTPLIIFTTKCKQRHSHVNVDSHIWTVHFICKITVAFWVVNGPGLTWLS